MEWDYMEVDYMEVHLHEVPSPDFSGRLAEHGNGESERIDLVARAALPQHFKPAPWQAIALRPADLTEGSAY